MPSERRERRRLPRVMRRSIPALALSWAATFVTGGAIGQVPPHRDIVSATIEEVPPIDGGTVAVRVVTLRIELAGPLPSPCTSSSQSYGFLLDADRNQATGLADPAFAGLGVDARISATCNPGTGFFAGPAGSTVTVTGPNANIIEISTIVRQLPSLRFSWAAFVQEGLFVTRLPKEPDHGAWGITELREW
jgi:hypothetical protein